MSSRREKISDSFKNRPSLMQRIKDALGVEEDTDGEDEKEKSKNKKSSGPTLRQDDVKGYQKGFRRGY